MHTRSIIEFSGGKDSLAMLHVLKDMWPHALVVWSNPGAPDEALLAEVDKVRTLVPNFLEVRGDVLGFIERHGTPVDTLPVWESNQFSAVEGDRPKFSAFSDCCWHNMWRPMHDAVCMLGATDVYRGQKLVDRHKSKLRDGDVVDGVTYHFPLQSWTDEDVFEYLGDRVPAFYAQGHAHSRDCWCCTAYLDYGGTYIEQLPEQRKAIVTGRLKELLAAVDSTASAIRAATGS